MYCHNYLSYFLIITSYVLSMELKDTICSWNALKLFKVWLISPTKFGTVQSSMMSRGRRLWLLHCKHECTYEYNQQIRKPQVMTSFLTLLHLTVLPTKFFVSIYSTIPSAWILPTTWLTETVRRQIPLVSNFISISKKKPMVLQIENASQFFSTKIYKQDYFFGDW